MQLQTSPDQISIVESLLSTHKEFASKKDLLQLVSKKISSEQLDIILRKLQSENKITYSKDNYIIWIYSENLDLPKDSIKLR